MNITQLTIDHLHVINHPDRASMGAAAARKAAGILCEAIANNGTARIILTSAPSQIEFLAGLATAPGIDWSLVHVFLLDEYVGLSEDHPVSFRNFQKRHLLSRVIPASFHGICGESSDLNAECARYAALLAQAPVDLVCLGIGENGHIAFNDPAVADFKDPLAVKGLSLYGIPIRKVPLQLQMKVPAAAHPDDIEFRWPERSCV